MGERDLDSDAFAAAVARAAWAAERVNRTLSEDDHVTQFELLTAAALWEMAERGVEVAVLEAGLGGRYDATSVVESRVTVLTNVGLEHTRWLGPTLKDIAEEKLAVLQPRHDAGARGRSRAGGARGGRAGGGRARVRGSCQRGSGARGRPLLARGSFQQRNFALARAAAEAYLRDLGSLHRERSEIGWEGEAHERAVLDAGASTAVPGRLHVVGGEPLTVLDGAHNPHAVAALVESLPEVLGGGRPRWCWGCSRTRTRRACWPRCWGCASAHGSPLLPSSRALSPAALQSLARQLVLRGGRHASRRRARALDEARRWAGERAERCW